MPETLRRLIWPLLTLTALIAVNLLLTKGFFEVSVKDGRLYGIPVDVLVNGSRVMLLAIAMSLVIATGGVDLSVGAIMALAGATAAVLVSHNVPIATAVLAAFAIGGAAGLVNGLLVARIGLQPIVATLVVMVAGRGVAQLLAGAPIVNIKSPDLRWFASGQILGLPASVWIVGIVFLSVWLLVRRTGLGLMVEALGDNPSAAREVGIPVATIKASVYIISGLCAALAGLIEAASVTAADTYNNGLNLELDAILAVVLGGTALAGGRFYLGGSILGAVTIQLLTTTLLLRDVNPNHLTLPKAGLVIAVCLLQSARVRNWFVAMRRKPASAAASESSSGGAA